MEIVYIMDPRCGWCNGNVETITRIYEKYKDKVNFRVLAGGMWTGDWARKNSPEVTQYIRTHDAQVRQRTGACFSSEYEQNVLDNLNIIFDSEPPSRAIVVANKLNPENAFPFAEDVIRAQFIGGKDINDLQVHLELAGKYGIGKDEFARLYESEEIKKETQKMFETVRQMGVTGFPTLLLDRDGELEVLAVGYTPFGDLDRRIQRCTKV
jgi:putative protein-disulfide isomerase